MHVRFQLLSPHLLNFWKVGFLIRISGFNFTIPEPFILSRRVDFASGHHKGDILLWRLPVNGNQLPELVSHFKLDHNLESPIQGLHFLGGKKDRLLALAQQDATAPASSLTMCSLSNHMHQEVRPASNTIPCSSRHGAVMVSEL